MMECHKGCDHCSSAAGVVWEEVHHLGCKNETNLFEDSTDLREILGQV